MVISLKSKRPNWKCFQSGLQFSSEHCLCAMLPEKSAGKHRFLIELNFHRKTASYIYVSQFADLPYTLDMVLELALHSIIISFQSLTLCLLSVFNFTGDNSQSLTYDYWEMNSVFTGETQEIPPWNIAHLFRKGKLICVMRKHSHISGNKYISLWENGDHHAFQSFKHRKHVIFLFISFYYYFFNLKHAGIAGTVVLLVRYWPSPAVFELPLLSIRTAFSAKIRNEF